MPEPAQPTLPAGWYPDPHVPSTERYFDGSQWTAQVRPTGALPPAAAPMAPKKKGKRKGMLIGAGVLAALIAGGAIANSGSEGKDDTTLSESTPSATDGAAATPEAASEDAPEDAAKETAEQVEAKEGSVENPLPQPYVAKGLLGGDKYSLTGRIVDANANAAVADYNMFNSEAPAGFKYVVVELTMTGIDPDGVEPSLAAFDLSLATAEGNRYNSEFIAFGEGMPSMSEGPKLYPGSAFTGYTAYIVPDTAEAFLLHDNSKYIGF